MAVVMQNWPGHPIPGMPHFQFYAQSIQPLPVRTSLPAAPILAPSVPQQAVAFPIAEPPLPPRNAVDLSRDRLITVLTYFASLLPTHFSLPVRLVVHGGACMLLHPTLYNLAQQQHQLALYSPSSSPHNSLPRRTATRDVDYLHRSFIKEWAALGVLDAGERLKDCIRKTARKFGLGEDWMNSDADIALPMAMDANGIEYDPIYADSIKANNVHLHTVFSVPNFTLVSVTPFWAVALKLVRYSKFDPGDICLLLRNGTTMSNVQWTPDTLERWLFKECWPMGYNNYDVIRLQQMRTRIKHAVDMVSLWSPDEGPPVIPGQAPPLTRPQSQPAAPAPIGQSHTQPFPTLLPPPPGQSQPQVGGWGAPYQQPPSTFPHGQNLISLGSQQVQRRSSPWTTSPPMQMPMAVIQAPPAAPQLPQQPQPSSIAAVAQSRSQPDTYPPQDQGLDDDPRFYSLPRHQRTRDRDRERRPSTSLALHNQHHRHSSPHPGWHMAGYQVGPSSTPNSYQPFAGPSARPAPGSDSKSMPATPYHPDPTQTRLRSQSHSYTPDPTAFEQSVANILAEGRMNYDQSLSRHPGGPSAVLANMNTNATNAAIDNRRAKEKHRAKDRKKDRFAKLWARYRDGAECSAEDDSGEDRGGAEGNMREANRERQADYSPPEDAGQQGPGLQQTQPQRHDIQTYAPTWHNNPLYTQPRPATTQPYDLYRDHHRSSNNEQNENRPPLPVQRARTPSPSRESRGRRGISWSRHRHGDLHDTSRGPSRSRHDARDDGDIGRSRSRSRRRPPPLELSPLPQMDSLTIF